MANLPILKAKVAEAKCISDTFNDFPVAALNQYNAAYFILKALTCLLIALMTLYIYFVLRLYTMPKVYEHNCTSAFYDLNTFDKNDSHIII
jgi:hypothetical protein